MESYSAGTPSWFMKQEEGEEAEKRGERGERKDSKLQGSGKAIQPSLEILNEQKKPNSQELCLKRGDSAERLECQPNPQVQSCDYSVQHAFREKLSDTSSQLDSSDAARNEEHTTSLGGDNAPPLRRAPSWISSQSVDCIETSDKASPTFVPHEGQCCIR